MIWNRNKRSVVLEFKHDDDREALLAAAAMFLAFGTTAALEACHRTGRGQIVETSLLEAATASGVYEAARYVALGTRPARIGQRHRGSAPLSGVCDAGWLHHDRWGAAETMRRCAP
jgi:crotonobetainyl-CoA:carnitine CoA-transferase CaiB-like acyl-CoA transferase